ncbi:Stp1/IreP family PP2C-type Ser/Thr phosphatase [Anaerovibrio sp.]|uniref:Stp1/IreP family PP2C-type Ser/Thr phosphatase n=1 Tax=Anaerovibrio sp. TaxID=1872532 RepID=UPI003F18F871
MSDIGLQRSLNEDSLLCRPPSDFVVADGMGGHVAGEVASHILTGVMNQLLSEHEGPLGQEGLREMVIRGNRAILASIQRHPERRGMGTTATCLHLEGGRAVWAHVGDSRLYLVRGGSMRQITRDHTYVNDLIASGSITPLEAETHPKRNMLMRAVGVEEYVQVDTGEFSLQEGDILLLCSDGLTNMVTEDAIRTVLEAESCVNPAASLVECARAGGGIDNISVIVVKYYEK